MKKPRNMMAKTGYPMFTKDQRSTFRYWFWHWLAFNRTAHALGVWRFRHLFHDIEKPFLRLVWPYEKVRHWHHTHRKHHLEYRDPSHRNWVDMYIDWECSHLTKLACIRSGTEEAWHKFHKTHEMDWTEYHYFIKAAKEVKSAVLKENRKVYTPGSSMGVINH